MSGQIWFTSDTHAFHRNIAGKAVSAWTGGYRSFNNEFEMTEYLILQINKYVKHDDILYHMGDWSFAGADKAIKFRHQLNVREIHLCYGNHDEHIRKNKIIDGIELQSLFTTVQDVKLVQHGHNNFFLSHYGHRIWIGSHKGYIHLYGHSHASLPMYGKSMDVGMDSAKRILGEYRPFHINEVIDLMKKREIEFPDKHDINSNVH
jgi:calcineurin-like phosphoesterase family protein